MAKPEDFYTPGQVDEQIDQLLLNDIPSIPDQQLTRALLTILRDDEDQQSLNHVLSKLHDKRNESFSTDTNIASLPHHQRKSVSGTMTQGGIQLKMKPKSLPKLFTLFAACFVVIVMLGSLLLVLSNVQQRKNASSNIASPNTTQPSLNTSTATPTAAPNNSSVIVSTGEIPTYQSVGSMETVLTTVQGITLYVHLFQGSSGFDCDGTCALTWHPLLFKGTGLPESTTKLPGKLSLGTDARGQTVVLYQGYPLYTNVGDTAPGQYNGRGADNSPWEGAAINIPTGL